MKHTISFIIFFNLLLICSATEYVNNGNFESHSGLPSEQSQISLVNNWKSSFCVGSEFTFPGSTVPVRPQNHSPDYYWTDVSGFRYPYNPTIPAKDGNGMVGMWEYEMIRQELTTPLSVHVQYLFSMYIRAGIVNIRSESSLVVYLSEDESKYDDDGSCNHGCFVDYQNVHAEKMHAINSIALSDVTFDNMYNDWVHVTFAFTPSAIGAGNANAIYKWLSIQLILNNPVAYLDQYEPCLKSYVLIDDVSITDFCDNFCLTNLPPLTYYIFQGGNKVFNTYTDLIGTSPNNGPQVFSTFIKDATYIYLEFLDRFSNTMYQYTAMDPNGLKDPDGSGGFFEDFLLTWNGDRTIGSDCEDFIDVYNGILIIKNCDRTVDINVTANMWDPPTTCHEMRDAYSVGFPNCCPNSIDIENQNYTSNDRVDVNDNIDIGQTAQVNITGQGTEVKFHAGNSINSGPFLYVASGSNAELRIVPCGTERKRRPTIRKIPIDQQFASDIVLYPQPAVDYCYLASRNPIKKIQLKTINNEEVKNYYSSNNKSINMDLQNIKSGFYFLYVEFEDGDIKMKKITILK